MKNVIFHWVIILIFFIALIALVFVGIPFRINAGSLVYNNNRYYILTTSRILQKSINESTEFNAKCLAGDFCLVKDEVRERATNVPIDFFPCHGDEIKFMCKNPQLEVKLDSALWLKVSTSTR